MKERGSTSRVLARWLGRLSFSLLIFAAVLAWDAYKASRQIEGRVLPEWRINVQYLSAALLLGLGLAGVRARHGGNAQDRG